ncbi:zinc finger BED domain-containing protein RICESLEEPER 2 isoform X1 [Morus notabilis]|uniref:zinc finger BED domain-containing protein RICESLEEPER 2 isoform X1 n=1 Tax=Morus notabilis TaxID=981085 RepID=UPI000CED7CD2|nr:zinc finger BED domain-containing protein RICESLEEPER 2 isoform X1 [Morus notabilis]XP_024023526.1 zinc finger BED domain-containing protein RICESLEEPER 2 isoform X1 [Morus notabilis]XP_024023527.1 zinc finger BED domain-containing protein RICESLEEPER 2 isoform X1 [Morus notabilis]
MNQFEKLPVGADQELKVKCKECGVVYMANSNNEIRSMRRHMQSCVCRDTRNVGQLLISQDKGTLALSAKRFDAEHSRELITTAIILHDLPFSFVEYEAVRATYQYLHPEITLVTRNTLKADVQTMFSREKARIKSMLDLSPGRICLTSDLWTSIVADGYLSLTAHFIDKDWVLQKRILNFCFMPSPHTGIALSEKFYALLCEWGIEYKVFTLTLDNVSANDVSVDLLKNQLVENNALISDGSFFHIRCCARVLNLVVEEGLKDIDSVVKKIRESVKYVRGSQIRKKKFLECVNLMGLDSKRGLRQDVPTRWSSTFLMLDSVLYYRRAFCHLELSDFNYKDCLDLYEWEKAEKICEFLEPFYNITCVFSGAKYPTANLYFPTVYTCYLSLKSSERSEDAYLSAMAKAMLTKFEKYWKDLSLILAIAIVFDPRYKLNFVDYAYGNVYGMKGSPQFLEVKRNLDLLFTEYSRGKVFTTNVVTSLPTPIAHKSFYRGKPKY